MSSIQIPQLGIAEIDQQHAKLIACIDRLELWERKGHGFAALLDALNALSEYAREHFTFEEDFLRRHHYPKLEKQVTEHCEFVAELARLTQGVLEDQIASDQVIAFVRDWITKHISEEDVAFAKFLSNTQSQHESGTKQGHYK